MYTFGPLIAKNSRSGRLLGGAPITVTTLDGVTLTTTPAPLVTNHEGYLPTFTADTDQRVILARPRGGDPLPLYAHEGIQDAAEAADTINTGRLSEDALKSTFASKASEPVVDTTVGTRVMVGGVMVYGDTGQRNINDLMVNGWRPAGGNIFVRRQNDIVTVEALYIFSDEATDETILRLPLDFRPNVLVQLNAFLGGSTPIFGRVMTNGDLRLDYTTTPAGARTLIAVFPTTRPWPTSLPGTPA